MGEVELSKEGRDSGLKQLGKSPGRLAGGSEWWGALATLDMSILSGSPPLYFFSRLLSHVPTERVSCRGSHRALHSLPPAATIDNFTFIYFFSTHSFAILAREAQHT